jgi:hypothetical protein
VLAVTLVAIWGNGVTSLCLLGSDCDIVAVARP